MEFLSAKCPDCGAVLNIESNRKQAFCTYCGAKIIVDNNRDYEYTYRHVDEAEIKRAETDQLIRLKELELEEQRMAEIKNSKKTKTKFSIALIVVGIICMVLGFSFHVSPNLSGLAILGILLFIIAGLVWITPKNKK